MLGSPSAAPTSSRRPSASMRQPDSPRVGIERVEVAAVGADRLVPDAGLAEPSGSRNCFRKLDRPVVRDRVLEIVPSPKFVT